MSWFQNPLASEFRGSLVLGDRAHAPNFICPRNNGRGDDMVVSWIDGPFNLSANDTDGNATSALRISYSFNDFKAWSTISVALTVGAVSAAAVTAREVVASLTQDTGFSAVFTATLDSSTDAPKVLIRQRQPVTRFKFFIVNGRGEEKLGFNSRAGVAELPTYFARHVIGGFSTYPDCQETLVALNMGNNVDQAIVTGAKDFRGTLLGYTTAIQADWQLFKGRSGIFNFQKITVDASDRITQIIEYPAGAIAGDFARKINYAYTGVNLKPDKITEIPYTLAGGDLVTP